MNKVILLLPIETDTEGEFVCPYRSMVGCHPDNRFVPSPTKLTNLSPTRILLSAHDPLTLRCKTASTGALILKHLVINECSHSRTPTLYKYIHQVEKHENGKLRCRKLNAVRPWSYRKTPVILLRFCLAPFALSTLEKFWASFDVTVDLSQTYRPRVLTLR